MTIIDKNKGDKIPYEVDGTKICFDDDLSINLAKRQGDSDVHIDICRDKTGNLELGTANARCYVAEIDIPPIEYSETVTENAAGDAPDGETGGMESSATREALPLDMDNVTLTLWALT